MPTVARHRLRLPAAAAVIALAGAALAGCSSSSSPSTSASSPTSASAQALSGTVTVFAASSLDEVFPALAKIFEKDHPGTNVKFSFAGSDTLAAQITQGAPADVFASASQTTMDTVVKAGDNVGTPTLFAKNTLEIAVKPGNPKGIETLADLTKPGLKVAECAASVPCGDAAVTALTAAKVKLTPVTYSADVASALNLVELGEVDAALVYHSSIVGADGKVQGVVFSTASSAVNSYPITAVKDSSNASLAQAFVSFVLSSTSEQYLLSQGFQAP
jgi:molybdate transport system substrate-binding protein